VLIIQLYPAFPRIPFKHLPFLEEIYFLAGFDRQPFVYIPGKLDLEHSELCFACGHWVVMMIR